MTLYSSAQVSISQSSLNSQSIRLPFIQRASVQSLTYALVDPANGLKEYGGMCYQIAVEALMNTDQANTLHTMAINYVFKSVVETVNKENLHPYYAEVVVLNSPFTYTQQWGWYAIARQF